MTSFRIDGMTESKRLKGQKSPRVSSKVPPWQCCLLRPQSQMAEKSQAHSQSLICFHWGHQRECTQKRTSGVPPSLSELGWTSEPLWTDRKTVCKLPSLPSGQEPHKASLFRQCLWSQAAVFKDRAAAPASTNLPKAMPRFLISPSSQRLPVHILYTAWSKRVHPVATIAENFTSRKNISLILTVLRCFYKFS